MLIGYARVSTEEQSLDLQLDALNQAGCKRVFTDKVTGARKNRPGLTEALSHLREGDVLVIWKLDRLGRTVKGLVDFVGELAEREVQFRSRHRRHRHHDLFIRHASPRGKLGTWISAGLYGTPW